MNDMSSAIVPKSDQLNADDLIAGPRTICIREVTIRATPEQPVSIHFDNDNGKPWKPCKSMSRVLVAAWGADAKAYVGRSLTLYRDPKVKWGGMEVGGIRISHMTNIERDMVMALTETKGKRAPFVVKQLANAPEPKSADSGDGLLEFANGLCERIRAAKDAAAVDAITGATGIPARRTWLRKNRPELADMIDKAVSDKAPVAEEDPFGLPPLDGPADDQRGEPTTLDLAKAAVDRATSDIDGIVDSFRGDLSDEDYAELQRHGLTRAADLEG